MRNRESKNMRKMTMSAVAFLVAWCFAMPISWAQPHDDKERAELAKALKSVKTPLQQGLKASAKEGTPISAKYEVEHDKLSRKLETSNDRYWSASREPQRSMTSRGYDPRQSPGTAPEHPRALRRSPKGGRPRYTAGPRLAATFPGAGAPCSDTANTSVPGKESLQD